MRFLIIILLSLLASCSNETETTSLASTDVSVSFGSTIASGALLTSGQLPSNLEKITIQAFSSTNQALTSSIAMVRPNFSATLTIPNGIGIRILAMGYDANNKEIYKGYSAPQNLTGSPIAVPITLGLAINITASTLMSPRGSIISLTATTAGSAPVASSPLLWSVSGGSITTNTNGGQASWVTPTTLGKYTVTAHVDPIKNPDQNPNILDTIEVQIINQTPTSASATMTTNEDTPSIGLTPTVIDPDIMDTNFTFTIVSQGAKGIASVAANQLVYTPNLNTNGNDTFTFSATDAFGASVTGTATVTITPINDAPAPTAPTLTTSKNVAGTTQIAHGDPDIGDTHTYQIVPPLLNSGSASVNATGLVTFIPNSGFVGLDNFSVAVTDNFGATANVVINLLVNGSNAAPTSTSAAITTNEDTASAGVTPTVVDPDIGDIHTFSIVSQGSKGTASIVANQLVYTPSLNANGIDSFTFKATDAGSLFVTGTASVNINPINDLPVLSINTGLTAIEDTIAPLDATVLSISDVDSPTPLQVYLIESVPSPSVGFIEKNGIPLLVGNTFTQEELLASLLTFSPAPNSNGNTTFSFRFRDETLIYSPAFISPASVFNISISAVNDAPVIRTNSLLNVGQNALNNVINAGSLLAIDIDNTPLSLTYTITTPTSGTLNLNGIPSSIFTQDDLNNNRVTYSPNTAFTGTDSFTFNLTDGVAGTIPISATFNIQVTAPLLSLNLTSSLLGGTLTANTVDLYATLVDVYTGVPTSGITVSFATTGAAVLTAPTAVTDIYGVATVSLSDTTAETVTITASSSTIPVLNATLNQIFSNNTGLNTTISVSPCNATWDLYGSPYLVTTAISINPGCRLQIDPYVIVKFNAGVGIGIAAGGTLDVYGTPSAPVVMTTINDDVYGGIFTGSTNAPIMGSWTGIFYATGSLGSISNLEMHYPNIALNINNTSPNITNFTAANFGNIGLYIHSNANQTTSPTVTNLVLNTSDTSNFPIYITGLPSDPTSIVAPVINGASITTSSTIINQGAIHLTGTGVNPTVNNVTTQGGGRSLYTTNNASGTFTNNTFNGALNEAIYLNNNSSGTILVDSSNTITNAPAPYLMDQAFPTADIYASLGAGVIDTYSVHISGFFKAANSILTNDPLNTGSSIYLATAAVAVSSGSRLQIDPYTVIKFKDNASLSANNSGTLDINGAPNAKVIMTSVNDNTIAPIIAGSTGSPLIGSWAGLNYYSGSLGSVSNLQMHYPYIALDISNASPTVTNFTATEFGLFGLYLHSTGGQTTSPTVTNIILTTTDTSNRPISMGGTAADPTAVVAPVIDGTSITTASTTSSYGAIHLAGIGVNPTIRNMTIHGGGRSLYATSNASGTFTGNTFDGALYDAIYLDNNNTGTIAIDSTNTISNAPAPYIMNQPFPTADIYATLGANVTDTYSVHLSGIFSAPNSTLTSDPLNTGASIYLVYSSVTVPTGSRLQIDPYTVMKFNSNTGLFVNSGGILDIYGSPAAPVVMTSVNDNSIPPIIGTFLDLGLAGSWRGITYYSGSLGSIANLQMHYPGTAVNINNASPSITNLTATNFSNIGLYLHSVGNQNTSPTVTNLVLNTTDTFNNPIYMVGTSTDATAIVAPIIDGTSIATASTNLGVGTIHLSGAGVNPTVRNMTINGGGRNLYATNNASGTFTNSTFTNAVGEAIYLNNNAAGTISINSTNTITNVSAPYIMDQVFPTTDIYATLGANVADIYSVHLSGTFKAANSIMTNDPFNTGASAYLVTGPTYIPSGSRLQIDPYTVLKFNSNQGIFVQAGGTLDIYGAVNAEVVMTTVNDDTVLPIITATSTSSPVSGSWRGIDYFSGSLGTISNLKVHYPDMGIDINNASPTIANLTATEFSTYGLYLHSGAGQTTSPNVTGLVLNTSDTSNSPIYMVGIATDATAIVSPSINGTSITTASTNTNLGVIHLSGLGVNPSITNMAVNGGVYSLYEINHAGGTFSNNIFNGASIAAIDLVNGASPSIDATNTVQNTPAAYLMSGQLLPSSVVPQLGVNGVNVADPYSLRVNGTLPASGLNYTMNPDPLGTGSSIYQISGGLNIASGARLVINPGTVIKAVADTLTVYSGGTLDIYGTVGQPVYFTSFKDDTVGGDTNLDGAATSPAMSEGLSANYKAGSLGSISFLNVRYSDTFNISSAIPMNDVSRFNGGFGMRFSGLMNQTISNLHIDHSGIGGDTALYINGAGTNPIFTGVNTVDKYSAVHEAVIIQTGANPNFQNFTIDIHGGNQPTLAIYDATTAVVVQNNTLQNGLEGIRIANGASPTIDNNIIRNSNTGIYLTLWYNPIVGQAGNVTVTNNQIVNNNIGVYARNSTSAIIANNLIRGNATAGVSVDTLQTLPIDIQNNLIVENTSTLGAVYIKGGVDALTSGNARLLNNTIANNKGLATGISGISADTYTTVLMQDNIFAFNRDSIGILSDINIPPTVITSGSSNNATTSSLDGITPITPLSSVTLDIYSDQVNPTFISNWYLSATAPELGTATGNLVSYLPISPYSQAFSVAPSNTNTFNLGYYHAWPSPIVSAANSTVTPMSTVNAGLVTVTITVTPRSAANTILKPGMQILASLGNSLTGAVISAIRDMGDGTYEVDVDGTLVNPLGSQDIITVTIQDDFNGPTIIAPVITW